MLPSFGVGQGLQQRLTGALLIGGGDGLACEQIIGAVPKQPGHFHQYRHSRLPPALFVHTHGAGADPKGLSQLRLSKPLLAPQGTDPGSQHPHPVLSWEKYTTGKTQRKGNFVCYTIRRTSHPAWYIILWKRRPGPPKESIYRRGCVNVTKDRVYALL